MPDIGVHDHCWHFKGGDARGSREEVCCQCAGTRTVAVQVTSTQGHGPYIPPAEATKEITYGDVKAN